VRSRDKRKVRRVIKYLVQWKGFIAEYDSWEKEEDLKNTKEVVVEFERRIVMVCLDTNIFLFILSIFLNFLFFDFFFLFIDNEEACDCSHMTCHMM